MEKYFKPVQSPAELDELKPRKIHHRHHHLHHNQDTQSHRYSKFDDTDRNTDDSRGQPRHHQHSQYLHESPRHGAHYPRQFHHSEEDELIYDHDTPVTLSRASSSSLSSSSSSSWYTESSANDPFTLCHAERPQHSLSCSNIPDVRIDFQEDECSDPIVFATIKHNKKGSVLHESSQQRGNAGFSALDRGHSRSDEAFFQSNDSGGREQSKQNNYGPLYKSASLNRCLAFSEENILLGVSSAPKRAVSSNQLPSKGILKNKETHTDIRKTKSMEVLSPRVAKGQGPGQKGKEITQANVEQARANFLQEKLQFSAFLDEITKSVISPSYLTSLGINNNKTPAKTTSNPVKPQLPPKKHRKGPVEETGQHPKLPSRQEKAPFSSSRKHSDCSNPDKLISYAMRNHHGSPPPHHHPHSASQSPHHGSNRKDRRPTSGDRFGRGGPHLTDETSTSPETSQSKQRRHHHHRKQQHSQHPDNQHFHQQSYPDSCHQEPSNSPPTSAQGAGAGVGSESSSTKSDSSRARDTASTATSHSSDQSGRHQPQHAGHSQQHRDVLCDADHLQALQEENADLHQNLLQTVVCIESLEAELQRTRDELSHVKEKYKSLLQTHTGTKQANNLLGEHLHIASESLSSERKYLLNRVSNLSSELEDAHRTIAALENINVPCLIKELLEKHFDSAEAVQKFLTTSAANSHSATSQQTHSQPHPPKAAHDWLTKPEAGPQRVTAFIPFKQSVPVTGNEGLLGQDESSHSLPFSVADISTAIYNKMAASYAARPQPIYPESQQQSSLATNHADTLPDLRQGHVAGDNWAGKGELKVTLLEQDTDDVSSVSAQQILDDFMQHLQIHKEASERKEQQSGQKCRAEVTE